MWFKSKLQSPDPEVRRQHLEHLEPEDELLVEIARTDPHPDVRSAALTRLVDLSALQVLAQTDQDTSIRSKATARLQTLLTGAESLSPPLETRRDFLKSCLDQRLSRFIARSGREPELRKLALSQILQNPEDVLVQDLLCEIAADDPVQEIRETAADPIHDQQRLQMLLEKTKGRDKSIHRLARERLDYIEAQRTAESLLEQCCIDIEQLCDHHFSADGKVEEVRLARIVADWEKSADVVAVMDQDLKTRFEAAQKSVDGILAGLAEQRRKRTDILDALRVHLTDTDAEPVAELIKRWHDLDEPTPQQAREFAKLVAEVTEHDSQRDRDGHRVVAKQGLLNKMEQAAVADTVRKAVLTRLEERWQSTPDPEDETQKTQLNERFLALREKLRVRLEKQAQELESRVAEVSDLLDLYESALADGKLQVAGSTHDKILPVLRSLDAPKERKDVLFSRLRAGQPRMAELKRWRHWSTEKKREELCESVAGLLNRPDMKITAVAKAVREAREAWKALDKSDGPSGRKLWRRFDDACEKAYAPCQEHFEQQKAQRQQSMERRVAICEELETLNSGTDWDSPPWRELTDAMRETERKWRVAGSVDRRERNTIQARYEQARAAIDEHLDGMRKQEIERREALITRIESLSGSEDSASATGAAKRAQREWKPVVQSGRRTEQDLWKRFRAACDAVFEHRKEQFAAADQERAQNLGEKQAVCSQIEEIAAALQAHLDAGTGDRDVIAEARKKSKQLNSGWQRIGPVPRDKQQAVDRQFQSNCKNVETICAQVDKQLKQQAIKVLREAAADCDRLELVVAQGDSVEPEAVDDIVSRLGKSPAASALTQRLHRLQQAASGKEPAQKAIHDALPANLEIRLKLCLELEIAANIDSPEEFKEDRMQYRVRQLSESMSGNRKAMGPAELEKMWYDTGPVPESEKAALEQRFNRALQALKTD